MKTFTPLIVCLCLLMAKPAAAQINFNVPGQFVVDVGLCNWRGTPPGLDLNVLGSRGVNVYYLYEFLLGNEKFSFHPGFGMAFESYAFQDGVTFVKTRTGLLLEPFGQDVRKSKLTANYVDIPLEFRFSTSPGKNAFRFSLGGKAGVLFGSHTKVRYKDSLGDVRTVKDKGSFYMERFRFGASVRIGYGPINLFGYYALNNLFQEGKLGQGVAITPFMAGITLSAL